MGSLAALYLLLGGEFIAAAQLIVYAGAIMVLFIFVIMLLNAGTENKVKRTLWVRFLGLPLLVTLLGLVAYIIQSVLPPTEGVRFGAFQRIGSALEVISELLLTASSAAVRSGQRADPHCDYRGDRPGPKRGRLDAAKRAARLVLDSQRDPVHARCRRVSVSPQCDHRVFMSIELMLNAVNLTFITFSYKLKQVDGHIFSFFVMVVAAAEAAVGLAIILTVFKNRQTLEIDEVSSLKN